MNGTEAVVTVFVALLTGGSLKTVVDVLRARAQRRLMIAETPERRADSSVQRAQQALLIMEGSLNAAVRRAEAAEATVHELEDKIDDLERALNDARERMNAAVQQLSDLRNRLPPR